MKHKLAAQLYTVRDELAKDFPGVLRELGAMGWGGVQISGLHGYDPAEIAEVLNETGMGTAGMHVSLQRLTDELDEVLREAELFRTKDVVCPYIAEELRNENGYRELRRTLNEIARRAAPRGIRISYHNHAFEFDTVVEGKTALEYLLEPSADNALLAEIDVYWVQKGGHDPVSFLAPYADRMPIIHLKDMSADERRTFAEIGTGIIDFATILNWCERSGVEWYAVEQDVCPGNPLDSLQLSLGNLNKLIASIGFN